MSQRAHKALLIATFVLCTIILCVVIPIIFTIRTNDTQYYTVLASGSETTGPEIIWETKAPGSAVSEENTSTVISMSQNTDDDTSDTAVVHARIMIVDVGQGSCAIIQSGGETAVFDTGSTATAQVPVRVLKDLGVTEISFCCVTHWDNDHAGAAIGIFKNFDVKEFLYADYEADTGTYQSIMSYISEHNMLCRVSSVGEQYQIGELTMTITDPVRYDYEEENSNSISAVFSYNGIPYVFIGGDTTEESERDILNAGISVDSVCMICNHHGSTTSSCSKFIKAVSPEYTIISCGKDNDYGHPAASVLKRIHESGSKLYRTDEQGDIVFFITDKGVDFELDPTDNWTAGTIKGGEESE